MWPFTKSFYQQISDDIATLNETLAQINEDLVKAEKKLATVETALQPFSGLVDLTTKLKEGIDNNNLFFQKMVMELVNRPLTLNMPKNDTYDDRQVISKPSTTTYGYGNNSVIDTSKMSVAEHKAYLEKKKANGSAVRRLP